MLLRLVSTLAALLCTTSVIADPALGLTTRYFAGYEQQQLGFTPKFSDCMKEFGGNIGGELQCYSEESERQDRQLNVAYQSALKRLTPERASQLRLSQRAWLSMRFPHCKLEREGTGAHIDSQNEAACLLVSVAFRARYLEALE